MPYTIQAFRNTLVNDIRSIGKRESLQEHEEVCLAQFVPSDCLPICDR